jgi:hypothetical protein
MQWFARNEHGTTIMLYRLSTLSLCVHLNGFKQVARKHGQII